jgi:hypothetical protein
VTSSYDHHQKSAPLLMCRLCQKYAYVTHGIAEWVCHDCTEKDTRVDDSQYDQPLATAATNALVPTDDDCGLSIDMLDADRLREWARLILVHGADISHWGSPIYVASKMQMIATGIEKAVRDIGTLRASRPACKREAS